MIVKVQITARSTDPKARAHGVITIYNKEYAQNREALLVTKSGVALHDSKTGGFVLEWPASRKLRGMMGWTPLMEPIKRYFEGEFVGSEFVLGSEVSAQNW